MRAETAMRDRDVRIAVRTELVAAHAGDRNTRIVEEMGVWSGSVRVDVAVINGELAGFELKSAKDNLARLPQQALHYNDVFDRMTIVTAENHLSGCLAMLPEWWGVTIARRVEADVVGLEPFRVADTNPSLKPIQLARLLWKSEAIAILTDHGLSRGYRSKSIDVLHGRLADELDMNTLRAEVRSHLKRRVNWLDRV